MPLCQTAVNLERLHYNFLMSECDQIAVIHDVRLTPGHAGAITDRKEIDN